jgi:hypothetical protein
MSYILDALKKSEQMRKGKRSRALLEVSLEEPVTSSKLSRNRGRWTYFLVIILFLSAGIFALRLVPRQAVGPSSLAGTEKQLSPGEVKVARSTTVSEAPVSEPHPADPATEKVPGNGPPAVDGTDHPQPERADPSPQQPTTAPPPLTSVQPGDTRETSEAVGPPAPAAAQDHSERKVITGAEPQDAVSNQIIEKKTPSVDRQAPPQTRQTESPKARQKPLSHTPPVDRGRDEFAAGKPEGAKAPHEPKAAEAKRGMKTARAQETTTKTATRVDQPARQAADSGIISDMKPLAELGATPGKPGSCVKWHELSSQIRDSIPKMSFSMLIYSKHPDQRWININGSKTREGDEIASGLKLEEITPDGGVFTYQGHRFFKGVVGD